MEYKPIKHGSRWTADDYRHLSELWYEGYDISDIAETLERTEFSIICQLPWKFEVKLSKILGQIEDKQSTNKTIALYSADYPQLIDIEIDTEQLQKARKQREKERNLKYENIKKLLDNIDAIYSKVPLSGLEELVLKVFSQFERVPNNSKNFKERLIWISGLSLLFSDFEYEILYTVYPNEGGKKNTYKQAAKKLDLPQHYIDRTCRESVKRLIMMVDLLSDQSENYNSWIKLDKLTYANLLDDNEELRFPTIELNYDKLPTELTMVEEFDFNKTQLSKLQKANIFCIGNLENFDYQDLRFELGLDADVARKLIMIRESYTEEEQIA